MEAQADKQTYVALDLETTGLIPEYDEIIEIGAVKFQNGHEIDIFQSLVNPHRPIPYNITKLCNISQEDVDAAPAFSSLVEGLTTFLGVYPIVGHNISFDVKFLSQKGIKLSNLKYDTLEMSKLLLFDLKERNLSAVAAHLGIPHPSAHRALADAIVGKDIFSALLNKLHELDPVILCNLIRLTAKTDWWLGDFLGEVAKERDINPLLGETSPTKVFHKPHNTKPNRTLAPNAERTLLDIEALADFFDGDRSLAQAFPNYENRPEQVEMMRAIAKAFNDSQHLIVEAGTGTGKSMAYLLPAAFFARLNSIPVVISTNTINLQEQLVSKDIPDLLCAIGVNIEDIQVALIKGRTNYLCLRRWEILHKAEGLSLDMIQFLARVQLWIPSTQTGDRSELNLDSRELSLWLRICAQGYDCASRQCPYQQQSLCFLHRTRKIAESAHLIVTNHALLLSEMASGAQVLPEYAHLIIDEAHHLEGAATDQLGTELREQNIQGHLDQIIQEMEGQRLGFLPKLEHFVISGDLASVNKEELEQLSHSLNLGVIKTRSRVSGFFNALGDLLQSYGEGQGEYDLHLRITKAMRAQPAWSDIEANLENLLLALKDITKALSKIHTTMADSSVPETLESEALSLFNTTEELGNQMNSLIFQPEENSIHWLTLGRKSNIIGLHSAPLHVGLILQNSLYSQKDALILTGATLSIGGNFKYLKERLSIDHAEELLLGSPFDYQHAALVYIASDIPEPGRSGYQKALAQALVSLCRITEGRCLILFTSHSSLRATQAAIQVPLEEDDILVLGQGLDGSPQKLLSSLRRNPRTVLLGAASFWEGVDIVGEPLSVLVIVRLPFSVPTDPVFAARSETLDDPFNQYTLPQAVLGFKQGFGRLIRSKDDRGVMVVLDSRLSSKSYRHVFLESLPSCQVEMATSRNLPNSVKEWLAKNKSYPKRIY